ncbi:hypothetical protein SAMN04487905_102326 [Actinopolyspora xinjiangensis]|uniref:Small secreted domain n=1 Tax=Actinopolyspora xinjiangensis TaxID=405564 RepID=A0A1H0QQR3_9ACTN|nr:hypothetical protein [Actinopolyspora xinjiangensis]SDP19036.1 hypothetical protein SAMN04487905_102326 [Actinopolyspora xinjiangensis]
MLKKTVAATGIAAAGMMAMAPVASADSKDNDGINLLNDNNISAVPIQACGNNIAVLGVVANILAAQPSQCVNAPVVDHPKAGS